MSTAGTVVSESFLHNESPKREVPRKGVFYIFRQRRFQHAVLGFFSFCFLYFLRVNLNVAIVAMTARNPLTLPNGTVVYVREFHWDTIERGKILGSFFYGYVTTQILGGWLGGKFGGVRVFGIGLVFSGFFTLLTPIMARTGIYTLIGLRTVIGIFEGVTFPSMMCIWTRWVPPSERTLLVVGAMAGMDVGRSLGTSLCGVISQTFGWSATFYITGTIALLWSCIWMTFAKGRPENDPWITQEELIYLRKTIPALANRKLDYPIKEMLRSPPIYALIFASVCEAWGDYTIMTQMPIFLNDVYNFDVQDAGLFTAIPYVASMIISPITAFFVDLINRKHILTLTQVRKVVASGGSLLQCFCMAMMMFSNTSNVSIIILTVITCLSGPVYTTLDVNYLDLAPQYAGFLSGITNTFNSGTGLVSSTVYGHILTNKTIVEWRIVFLMTAGMYLLSSITYGLFGSSERQLWTCDIKNLEKIEEQLDTVELTSQ